MVVKKTEALENGETDKNEKPSSFLVLNEVVIDRGPSPYLSNIDLYLDGKHITSVQGDGLIVSTPTGKFTIFFHKTGASICQILSIIPDKIGLQLFCNHIFKYI